jgi:hypothetical protein
MRDQFDLILDLLWNLAPEWVNWIAIDQNGAIYGYSSKPEQSSRGPFWVVQSQEYEFPISLTYVTGVTVKWRELIFQRQN